MKIMIDVPSKEFGLDIRDNFQDFFSRLEAETKRHLKFNTNLVCGAYELETIEMFLNAFKEMQIIPAEVTNGELLEAMYPSIESRLDEKTGIMLVKWTDGTTKTFKANWWNSPCEGWKND